VHLPPRWALAFVQLTSSFLWDIVPTRIPTPGSPARNLVTIPTTLPTVEAEFVEIFGVCLEGSWKKKPTQNVGIITQNGAGSDRTDSLFQYELLRHSNRAPTK